MTCVLQEKKNKTQEKVDSYWMRRMRFLLGMLSSRCDGTAKWQSLLGTWPDV
jgi:hypothetical protein